MTACTQQMMGQIKQLLDCPISLKLTKRRLRVWSTRWTLPAYLCQYCNFFEKLCGSHSALSSPDKAVRCNHSWCCHKCLHTVRVYARWKQPEHWNIPSVSLFFPRLQANFSSHIFPNAMMFVNFVYLFEELCSPTLRRKKVSLGLGSSS